jgi:predicted O-linked N-acetylglucosamine transferase (SPINDLY family)
MNSTVPNADERSDPARLEAAAAECRAALALRPESPELHDRLSHILYRLGRLEAAALACRRALQLRPGDPAMQNHLGIILIGLGDFAAAEQAYRAAVRLDPAYAEAFRNLGDLYGKTRRFEDCVKAYREALLVEPAVPATWNNMALALGNLARNDEADFCYGKALQLDPDFLAARINRCVDRLRLIYRTEAEIEAARAQYAAELESLCGLDLAASPPSSASATGTRAPFLLAYQGRVDRDLQARYGGVVARIMAGLYPAWTQAPEVAPPQPGEKIRVGILSAFFHNHSNWKIPIKGWLAGLDPNRFQLFGYHAGHWEDEETAKARALCHRFIQGLPSLEHWAEAIRADRLHVLIIPGLGMDTLTLRLAALRLAPRQATSWGHPDTSGLPTIDDYLSSDLMEPPDGASHYTERLVRLPNLSIWYEPPNTVPEPVSRADLGLPEAAVLYWCCQSLFKYLPRDDHVFPRIVRRVADARFLFIESAESERMTQIFRERLDAAFAAAGMDAGSYCVFLPSMPLARFAAVCRLADVFLDSVGWSGCNSTLEALAMDLPVATMAGDLMRGRHSAAILAMLGLPELVADDIEGFVDLAVRLGRDRELRQGFSARIARTRHRLYRDQAAIDGLEAYLEAAARGRFP